MWLFKRADVVAHSGVIAAGVLALAFHSPYPDYVVGPPIGLYVVKEAIEILKDARRSRPENPPREKTSA